jgi:hypothetical protein
LLDLPLDEDHVYDLYVRIRNNQVMPSLLHLYPDLLLSLVLAFEDYLFQLGLVLFG